MNEEIKSLLAETEGYVVRALACVDSSGQLTLEVLIWRQEVCALCC